MRAPLLSPSSKAPAALATNCVIDRDEGQEAMVKAQIVLTQVMFCASKQLFDEKGSEVEDETGQAQD